MTKTKRFIYRCITLHFIISPFISLPYKNTYPIANNKEFVYTPSIIRDMNTFFIIRGLNRGLFSTGAFRSTFLFFGEGKKKRVEVFVKYRMRFLRAIYTVGISSFNQYCVESKPYLNYIQRSLCNHLSHFYLNISSYFNLKNTYTVVSSYTRDLYTVCRASALNHTVTLGYNRILTNRPIGGNAPNIINSLYNSTTSLCDQSLTKCEFIYEGWVYHDHWKQN